MVTSVPLIAQVPIRAPTANRMKMAPIPELTLAIAASLSSCSVWPRRHPRNTAIIVATTDADLVGAARPAVLEQIVGQPDQHDETGDRNDRLDQGEGRPCRLVAHGLRNRPDRG